MTSAVSQEIYFLADDMTRQDDITRQDDMTRQGFQSLANNLSHLKMTLKEYAIFFIFLYCG
ncbi:MAG: hypothetical protein F6K54_23655 [Okeania sp. SIO3B5]|uniref:hypothetical protein n=1 Tax=Okeania sp. SIO3B5 TaxID=2607811 RepID=UPI001401110E|nr:hypothetical protein [Okeania sp. SIO3B5]NEO55799.1 hypothetical protein [Okeania sp. SIO3B5]